MFTASVEQPEGLDPQYVGCIEDPEVYDLADGYWSDGLTIRLATQEEKDAWPAADAEDIRSMQKAIAKEIFEGAENITIPIRAFRAVITLFVQEINKLRVLHGLPEYTNTQIKNALWQAIEDQIE